MIYFIQTHDKKYIKIGYTFSSKTIKGRLAGLQSANPEPLKILKTIKGNALAEKDIQNLFSNSCIQGEWFYATTPLLCFIDEIKISWFAYRCFQCNYEWIKIDKYQSNCRQCGKSNWEKKKRLKNNIIKDFKHIIKENDIYPIKNVKNITNPSNQEILRELILLEHDLPYIPR